MPYNPRYTTTAAYYMQRVWADSLSLATTQEMISLPGGTKMFQFPPFPPLTYVFSQGCSGFT